MSSDQILLKIQHYHYDVVFGNCNLAPLENAIVISSTRKIYDANVFVNQSVDENDVLLCEELKIRVSSKNIAGVVPLLQQLTNGHSLPEEELRLLPRHPQGLAFSFPRARLTGGDLWQLNTQDDQAITLEFLARADASGKIVRIL